MLNKAKRGLYIHVTVRRRKFIFK